MLNKPRIVSLLRTQGADECSTRIGEVKRSQLNCPDRITYISDTFTSMIIFQTQNQREYRIANPNTTKGLKMNVHSG